MEGFNSAWNGSSTLNSSIWVAIDHMRKEEGLAVAKYRENLTTVSQRLALEGDHNNKRNIGQKNKLGKLMNLVKSYRKFTNNLKLEYVKLVSATLEN